MQRAHLWSKFHLHGKKISIIFLLLFLLMINTVDAQPQLPVHAPEKFEWDSNIPHYDDRFLHYGFTLGLNSTRFRAVESSTFFNDPTFSSIRSSPTGGFDLGFVMNMRLSRYFDFRVLPGVAFYTRAVQYAYQTGFVSNQTAESVFIETPLLLKYKSQRRRNHRLYMVGGLKPCIEAGAKKNQKKKSDLRTQNLDLCIEYGFGIDLYFKFFKFAPEIRFSHGLSNLLINDPNAYSQNLSKLTTHTVTLYFFFE